MLYTFLQLFDKLFNLKNYLRIFSDNPFAVNTFVHKHMQYFDKMSKRTRQSYVRLP